MPIEAITPQIVISLDGPLPISDYVPAKANRLAKIVTSITSIPETLELPPSPDGSIAFPSGGYTLTWGNHDIETYSLALRPRFDQKALQVLKTHTANLNYQAQEKLLDSIISWSPQCFFSQVNGFEINCQAEDETSYDAESEVDLCPDQPGQSDPFTRYTVGNRFYLEIDRYLLPLKSTENNLTAVSSIVAVLSFPLARVNYVIDDMTAAILRGQRREGAIRQIADYYFTGVLVENPDFPFKSLPEHS